MQFVVIGRDGKDAQALDRRMAVRDKHLALGDVLRERGWLLYAAALLDESGTQKMVGSVMIFDVPSRKELDEWLKDEPYVVGKVWEDIEVSQCKVGPSFMPAAAQKA
jgi:uncharacterized protein